MTGYFGLVVVSVLLVLVAGAVFSVARDIFLYAYESLYAGVKLYQPLSAQSKDLLIKYSSYYKLLSNEDKLRFQKRLQRFMYSKKFIPRGFKEITTEMRVLISAAAVQLTFGLPHVYLTHFDKILVYPDSYYSIITRRYHVGEVNPRMGVIILSWRSFSDISESRNIGIHEMAHAIHFENRIKNEEFNFFDKEGLEQLEEITKREIAKIRSGEEHFFRSYAGTNGYEFFAVALEYFFEQPVQFQSVLPDLYDTLSRLLNQDPVQLHLNTQLT